MNQAIILSIGYDNYIIPAKAGMAGKLIELLSQAVPARRDYQLGKLNDVYRIQPLRPNISVKIVGTNQILPPTEEDFNQPEAVELKTLRGAVLLLKGGAA